MIKHCLSFIIICCSFACLAQKKGITVAGTSIVGEGWANNSVNVTVFRKNSLVTNNNTQYIAFYDKDKFVVVGKRTLPSGKWQLQRTAFTGNADDAHNVISIMTDGDDFLHIAWDHHNNKLHYAKSVSPGSLEFSPQTGMTGIHEGKVSYPEFYRLQNGDLLFFYRDGGSGNGNLLINKYSVKDKQWKNLQQNLIDGEGKRNAYWQACTDEQGGIHISWVWRESPDVASNHDLCYTVSKDGGMTWQKSNGEKYTLPITASTAEVVCHISQHSELINQTSMVADKSGNPYIASYWREANDSVPQYHVVFKTGSDWKTNSLSFRKTPFSLSGAGTKRIPIARPQLIAWQAGKQFSAALLFRDTERGSKISIAYCENLSANKWSVKDIYEENVGAWEPTYDTELWKQKHRLHVFVQKAEQVDGEGKANVKPEMIKVLECLVK
ncbi:BNR repeat-containing protein [Pinibacter soli]|uniref:BNR repeat-containing protein n=1 Tax=Pinibacter soli TaxID=3044211 RepID=A0ABT6RI09_9BACT|nr:BNR repeat-containing protein [Pinibacter soli]MDI3321467.1 BNR repeat-containing protein [Pinibacter soli]